LASIWFYYKEISYDARSHGRKILFLSYLNEKNIVKVCYKALC